jgi:hypothetical protein
MMILNRSLNTQPGVCPEFVKREKTQGALTAIDAMATKMELRAMKNKSTTILFKVH